MSRLSLVRASASTLKTWRGCPARVGYRKLDQLPDPGTKATAQGTAVHLELELYGKLGIEPQSTMGQALVPYHPPLGMAAVEVGADFSTPSSPWTGRIDLAYDWALDAEPYWDDVLPTPRSRNKIRTYVVTGQPAELGTTGITVIHDWKTSSSLANAKTAEELMADEAVAIYFWEAFLGGAKRVLGRWVWVEPSGKTREVWFELTLAQVVERMIELDGEAAVMQAWLSSARSGDDLPKSPSYCWSFRERCPYYERCMPATTFSMEDAK